MMTRRFVLACAAAAGIGILGLNGPAHADLLGDANEKVQVLADQALSILADKSISRVDREARLKTLFLDNFDVKAIGKFVIASHWRTATDQERADFLAVFQDYVVKTYAVQLGQYAGEKFKVLSAQPEKRGVVVISQVAPPNRPPIELKWRLRKPKSGSLWIVDVVVENISMALTQRQEFAAVIQQRGGTLQGLIVALREKIQELESKEAASN